MREDWELVIIGGGPAGLAAGLYATRSGIKTLLLEGSSIGGQALFTDSIENYPGFSQPISGLELLNQMRTQAEGFGLQIRELIEVSSIETEKGFRVKMANGDIFYTSALIGATGAEPRWLDVPGAKELTGRGISYCATCDGPLFKDKEILVVGGGNAAIEEALYLVRFASRVYIAHRRGVLRADAVLQKRIFREEKVKILWNSVVYEVRGKDRVEGVVLQDVVTKGLSEIAVSGVFVYIGTTPKTAIFKNVVKLDDQGYIITDLNMGTSHPGIFAAGDCIKKGLRQIVTAVGDGATAAMMAYHYLQALRDGVN